MPESESMTEQRRLKQDPALFAAALDAARRVLNPQGLNPGVLIDP
jgi:hypothetical protein